MDMDVSTASVWVEIRVLTEWVLLRLLKGAACHHGEVGRVGIITAFRPNHMPTTYPSDVLGTPVKTHVKKLFPQVQRSIGISRRLRCASLGETHPGCENADSARNVNVGRSNGPIDKYDDVLGFQETLRNQDWPNIPQLMCSLPRPMLCIDKFGVVLLNAGQHEGVQAKAMT